MDDPFCQWHHRSAHDPVAAPVAPPSAANALGSRVVKPDTNPASPSISGFEPHLTGPPSPRRGPASTVGERPPKCPGEARRTPRRDGDPPAGQDARHAVPPVRHRVRAPATTRHRRALDNEPIAGPVARCKRRHRPTGRRPVLSPGRPPRPGRGARRTGGDPPPPQVNARGRNAPVTGVKATDRREPRTETDPRNGAIAEWINRTRRDGTHSQAGFAAAFGVPGGHRRNYVTKCGNRRMLDANGPATNGRSPGHRSTPTRPRRCRRHRLADRGRRAHPRRRRLRPHTPAGRRRPRRSSSASTTPSPRWRPRRGRTLTLTAAEWAVLERDGTAWIVRDDPAELVAAAALRRRAAVRVEELPLHRRYIGRVGFGTPVPGNGVDCQPPRLPITLPGVLRGASEWRDHLPPKMPRALRVGNTVAIGCAYADSEVQMIWRPGCQPA